MYNGAPPPQQAQQPPPNQGFASPYQLMQARQLASALMGHTMGNQGSPQGWMQLLMRLASRGMPQGGAPVGSPAPDLGLPGGSGPMQGA